MNKTMRIGATIFALTMVVAACGGDDEEEATTTSGPEATTVATVEEETTSTVAAGPSATATPTEGLVDGDTVTVTIAGFTPGLNLGITMCASTNDSPIGAEDCDLGAMGVVTAAADGTGSGSVIVKGSPIGSNAHDCRAEATVCLLSVGELTAEADAERSGDMVITFG